MGKIKKLQESLEKFRIVKRKDDEEDTCEASTVVGGHSDTGEGSIEQSLTPPSNIL